MSIPRTRVLSCRSSSSSKKHRLSIGFAQEVAAQEKEGKTLSPTSIFFWETPAPTAPFGQSGNMASRLAHDLVNILAAIQGNTQLAALNLPQHSSLQKYFHNILSASQRGHEFLQHLLSGMSHQQVLHEELDLGILVEVLGMFRATLPTTITIEKIDRLSSSRMMRHSTQLFRMLSHLQRYSGHEWTRERG